MPQTHEEIMIECLKMATQQGFKGEEARAEADKMFSIITGRSLKDIQGRRMQYQELPKSENAQAKVIGRDSDIDPDHPFSDYVKK